MTYMFASESLNSRAVIRRFQGQDDMWVTIPFHTFASSRTKVKQVYHSLGLFCEFRKRLEKGKVSWRLKYEKHTQNVRVNSGFQGIIVPFKYYEQFMSLLMDASYVQYVENRRANIYNRDEPEHEVVPTANTEHFCIFHKVWEQSGQ